MTIYEKAHKKVEEQTPNIFKEEFNKVFNINEPMTLNEYEKRAVHTKLYPEDKKIEYCALGLTGESGEIAEKVKKWLRGDKQLDYQELIKELGDVLWYVTAMATDIGSSLEEVAQVNIKKLTSRKKRNLIKGDGDNR